MKHFSFWTLHKAGKNDVFWNSVWLKSLLPLLLYNIDQQTCWLSNKTLYIVQHYLNAVKELILCIFLISLFSSNELYWTTFRLDRIAGGPPSAFLNYISWITGALWKESELWDSLTLLLKLNLKNITANFFLIFTVFYLTFSTHDDNLIDLTSECHWFKIKPTLFIWSLIVIHAKFITKKPIQSFCKMLSSLMFTLINLILPLLFAPPKTKNHCN